MVCSELKDLNYSAIIARKLASVHHLNVPIKKDPTWLFDTINGWIKDVGELKPKIDCPNEQKLFSFDFESEFACLKKMLDMCESPITFCHNDLQEGNILLPAVDNPTSLLNSNQMSVEQFEDHIVLIDFEYCAYNFRGFDLGNHFCERMFDYSNPDWPHFYTDLDAYPDDQAKRYFVTEYLKQAKEFKFDQNVDTVDHIIKEADFYALASHFIWTLWSMVFSKKSSISFGYMVCLDCFIKFVHFSKFFFCLRFRNTECQDLSHTISTKNI